MTIASAINAITLRVATEEEGWVAATHKGRRAAAQLGDMSFTHELLHCRCHCGGRHTGP